MMKPYKISIDQRGFALVTAIMMLFAATVLGLMVTNSSEIEILLSGAQQRYENDFNIADGAVNFEAKQVLTKYSVDPSKGNDQVLSPSNSIDGTFDPGNDMTEDTDAPYTVIFDRNNLDDAAKTTPSSLWPIDNLLESTADADDMFDFHYRTLYIDHRRIESKGNSAEIDSIFNTYWQTNVDSGVEIQIGFTSVGT